jgi:sec-independent protein translocase protein TatA
MFGLGATELAIILVIIVVLFGARRLPEIGSGVGKAIKNFRAGMTSEIDVTPSSSSPDSESRPDEITESQAAQAAKSAAAERQKSES